MSRTLLQPTGAVASSPLNFNILSKIKSGGFSPISKRLLGELKFARRSRPVSFCPPDLTGLPSRTHIRLLFRFRLLRRSTAQTSKVWRWRECLARSRLTGSTKLIVSVSALSSLALELFYSPLGLLRVLLSISIFYQKLNLEMARVELASEMIPKRYLHS